MEPNHTIKSEVSLKYKTSKAQLKVDFFSDVCYTQQIIGNFSAKAASHMT